MSDYKINISKRTILVVDDTLDNLRLLMEMLNAVGYKVIPAQSGVQALSMVQSISPDLILLDIIMPEIDGYEVCKQLKANEYSHDIPIIFISALDEVLDKVKAFSMGGVDYITKPFQVEEVIRRVETHLNLRNLQRHLQQKNEQLQEKNEQLQQEIIKRKQTEEELKRAKQVAELANCAKNTFLANMSHELRTPLNAILGFAQILNNDRNLTNQQKKGIQVIQYSGEHLLTLINDILDFSKIEAGKLKLMPIDFLLPEFLKKIADLFKIRAEQKGIEFFYEPLSQLPTVVYADEKRLRQVLLNLLSNAIKFTQKGQVSFKVNYQHFPNPSQEWHQGIIRFEVEDSGIGILAEHLETIFLPFQQVSEQAQIEGTGLGLPICKKLIKMMGGQLLVQSMLDVGSHFWFEIPLQKCHFSSPKNNQITSTIIGFNIKGKKESQKKEKKDFRILIVDEKWENRIILTHLLIPLGFNILEANNGQEALKKANEFCPDAILMDLKMPIMDGLECTRRLRQNDNFKKTCIIALSAKVLDYQEQGLEAGYNAFITKPLNINKFFQILAEHCPLEWIYDISQQTDNLQITTPVSEIIPPNIKQIKMLLKFANIGDVHEVTKTAEALLENNPHLQPFIQEVCQLAKNFKIRKLKRFLNQYLSEKEGAM
ncbi:response regulator [Candidatus Parabeggiatoa sp. HSG14]|uniref:response regulator n=1 Tax=Candidatus Parabeggiatoa sp. HSG14 TaxID=3055593 RepID=UPI0025A88B49|nr:response regulator [Thiotrichales bacterium HSG14]